MTLIRLRQLTGALRKALTPRNYQDEADTLREWIRRVESKRPQGWCGDSVHRSDLDWLKLKALQQNARRERRAKLLHRLRRQR